MEKNNFDKNIRKKLKDFEAEFNPNAWSAFEERLNLEEQPVTEPEIDDIYFDGVVYDKLSKLEEPYNPAHWSIMADRLDDTFSIRNKILKYKVLELALVFLALFTFLQLFPLSTPSASKQVQTTDAQATPLQLIDANTSLALNPPNVDNTVSETIENQTQQQQEEEIKTQDTAVENLASPSQKPDLAIGLREIKTIQKSTSVMASPAIQESLAIPASVFSSFKPIPTISLYSVKQTEYSTKIPTIAPNDFASKHFQDLEAVASKEKSTTSKNLLLNAPGVVSPIHSQSILPLAFDDETLQEKDLPYELTKLKQAGIRFGMYSTLDYNYVLTPYDVLFESEAQTRTAIGYGAGFSLGFQFSRFELETGAAYSIKKYAPEFSETIGRTNQDTPQKNLEILVDELRDIELNVLKIPLNLRYTYGKYGKWRASILAGASLNMALQANYDRQQTFNGSAIYQKRESYERFKANLDKPLVLDNKKYPDGLLEGGNFMENSYFTANLGLGLERIISPRWSLFFQPSYHHFIQVSEERLGPNKDRINTFSISAGAKVNFR